MLNVLVYCSNVSFKFDCFSPVYFSASRSEVKLKVEVNGFNLQECAKIFSREIGIKLTNDKQLCAGGEDNKDSCEGDSGNLNCFPN